MPGLLIPKVMTDRVFKPRRGHRTSPADTADASARMSSSRADDEDHSDSELSRLTRSFAAEDKRLIAEKLDRMDQCSFVKDAIFPEIQQLLQLPPPQAREGLIVIMSNIALQGMLFLASAVGPALDLSFEADAEIAKCPKITLVYVIMLALCVIFGAFVTISTTWFVNDFACIADSEVHGVVVRSDRLLVQCWFMTTSFFVLGLYVLLFRLWMFYYVSYEPLDSGENSVGSYFTVFVALTVALAVISQGIAVNCYQQFKDAFPRSAMYWVKCLAPPMMWFDRKQAEKGRKKTRWFTLNVRRSLGIVDGASNGAGGADVPVDGFGGASAKTKRPLETARRRKAEIERSLETYLESKGADILAADRDEFLAFLEPFLQQQGGAAGGGKLTSTATLLATRIFDECIQEVLDSVS